jgi:hypothetical protein
METAVNDAVSPSFCPRMPSHTANRHGALTSPAMPNGLSRLPGVIDAPSQYKLSPLFPPAPPARERAEYVTVSNPRPPPFLM